ncbi:MAG: beta-glucosidase [Sphingomonadales bacterium]|nr:beta-glucosidase [Sphingomonadales bacterium]
MTTNPFPADFLWGAATAAYQIEGSPLADGAGPSIWQRFTHDPRLMAEKGSTGDIACDHYNRMEGDVDMMAALGLQAYRFSMNWGRFLPEGTGRVNDKGADFYSRLVDRLLAKGIEPLVTLYHWDLPAALDDRGGWLNRDSAEWFAEYADVAFRKLGDRVKKWVTLNEPWVVTDGGYLFGALAPGHRNMFEAPIASHNLMRAHGRAVQAYRAGWNDEIGLVVNVEPKYPATESDADLAATGRAEAYMNRQYLDPALLGSYPCEMSEVFGEAWPKWPAGDAELIRQKIDFLGLNYYTRNVVRDDPSSWPTGAGRVRQDSALHTETDWEVYPAAMTRMLTWVKERYGDIPLYITENGAAFSDPPTAEGGRLADPLRVDYLKNHIRAVGDAIAAGVDVRGYMVWSLMDNLEWALGYSKRFGIVHVNYATQERTPKDSARLYSQVIASNADVLCG